jgi:hypothetical protein
VAACAGQAYLDASSDFAKGCLFTSVVPRVKRVVRDILRASLPSFLPPVEHNIRCFQLFGADILLDEDLTPWLLGFTPSPNVAFGASSPRCEKYAYGLLSRTIGLTVEMLFPPTTTMMALWSHTAFVEPLPASSSPHPRPILDEFEVVAEGISLSSSKAIADDEEEALVADVPSRSATEPYPEEVCVCLLLVLGWSVSIPS